MVNQNWFSASIPKAFGMVKIATFAKPENVMCHALEETTHLKQPN
jgi:hypothetical protein